MENERLGRQRAAKFQVVKSKLEWGRGIEAGEMKNRFDAQIVSTRDYSGSNSSKREER
jgi:hypothetical protein